MRPHVRVDEAFGLPGAALDKGVEQTAEGITLSHHRLRCAICPNPAE
jgi:hypothetical protein